jgi:hypothetical protein
MTALRRDSVGCASQDRLHPEVGEHLPKPVDAMLFADGRDRGGEGFSRRRLLAVSLAKGAGPVPLLGQVDELEIAGEGAGDRLGTLDGPARDYFAGREVVVLAIADHSAAQPFHVLQQRLAAPLGEYDPAPVAEQADFPAKGLWDPAARIVPTH